jgi:hypothetical protein
MISNNDNDVKGEVAMIVASEAARRRRLSMALLNDHHLG